MNIRKKFTRHNWTDKEKLKIIEQKKSGKTWNEIAVKYGCSGSNINILINNYIKQQGGIIIIEKPKIKPIRAEDVRSMKELSRSGKNIKKRKWNDTLILSIMQEKIDNNLTWEQLGKKHNFSENNLREHVERYLERKYGKT